jgi:tight adherence protein B
MPGVRPENFINLVIAASVFGLVLSLWLIWLLVWVFRRMTRAQHVQRRLGTTMTVDGAQQGPARVLRLWRDGKESTTLVPGRPRRFGVLRWLRGMLDEAGIEASVPSVLLSMLSIMAAVFVLSLLLSRSAWLSLAAALVALQIGWIVLTERISRRASKFEAQLVDSMELAARSLRAGHPLSGSFRLISEEISAPVGRIFAEICQHQGLGASLDQAMRVAAANCPSADFKLFATSIVIQVHSGGNLAEMMERLAYVMRERMRLARRVRVLTAQTQFSKRVLLALPFVIFILLNFLNPKYMKPLYTTSTGQMLLFISAAGLILGAWIMNRLVILKE